MNDDFLKLDKQLCFPLYACSRQVIRLYKPVLDPLGLTYTQYITLMVLWETDHISVKELGERLFLDSGTLTPLLKKMENQGLVRRVRSLEDERVVVIHLTEEGKKMKDKAAEVPRRVVSCLHLDQEDAKNLHRILHLILEDTRSDTCLLEESAE
ncbi:MarR family winged helix-turn-helix transcriptional regulator [Anoxynatronum buryatiense]|uniref:HTH-type transcriptional regulator SarZ n=1 Tax=Anoxynatronum buryatiense TaxID=489973 RepID=A0AA46AJK5_9CLOT|nr:MarR family transcriptional regulator [Anoxynatronum buryatiense]SMP61979.1 DNA-binding transcriptional regulator, MarR family [Anoxynatronum buryatiense]